VVFGAALAIYAAVAVYVTLGLDKVDWDSVATTSRGFDVAFGGAQPSLSRIGFAEAPLLALLQIPLVAAAPCLGTSALAGPLTSAALAALACVVLCRLMVETGTARWFRWLLVLGFGLNPTWLYAAVTGSAAPLVCFFVVSCGLYVTRWTKEGILRDLVTCGLIAGAALMSQLEAGSLTIAVALGVCLVVGADRGGGWARVEGTLITLLLPVAAVAALWGGVCWALMGDPLYSLREDAAADRACLVSLETALCASLLLWCRWAATRTHPVLAGIVPTLLVATTGVLVAGWERGAPAPWAGYGYLQPLTHDVQTFGDIRRVAAGAAEEAGDGVVIVDSAMAFAVALASGRPDAFGGIDPERPEKMRAELSRATHLLTDRHPREAQEWDLPGGRRAAEVWSMGEWRLFRLAPNVE
jgi:hypothetical protein